MCNASNSEFHAIERGKNELFLLLPIKENIPLLMLLAHLNQKDIQISEASKAFL